MVEKGAGIYIEDAEVTENTLLKAINLAKENLVELQEKSLSLAKYDGAQKIVEQLEQI